MRGLQTVWPAELRDRLAASLEKRSIEITRHDFFKHAGETCCHSADATTQLQDRLAFQRQLQQSERLQEWWRLSVTRCYELSKIKLIADLVVEYPTRFANNIVDGVFAFGSYSRRCPRHVLSATRHKFAIVSGSFSDAH